MIKNNPALFVSALILPFSYNRYRQRDHQHYSGYDKQQRSAVVFCLGMGFAVAFEQNKYQRRDGYGCPDGRYHRISLFIAGIWAGV